MKQCTKCNVIKDKSEFTKGRPRCRSCRKIDSLEYRERNKEKCKESLKRYHDKYPNKNMECAKRWRKINPDKVREYKKSFYLKNKHRPMYAITRRMTAGLWASLRCSKGGRSWESIVGYTVKDLMDHLEKQFLPGMSWENMGEWHIDHIIPVSAFHYETTDDIDFKKCWALSNLQPMWAMDNIVKSDKVERPFQPSLAMPL